MKIIELEEKILILKDIINMNSNLSKKAKQLLNRDATTYNIGEIDKLIIEFENKLKSALK